MFFKKLFCGLLVAVLFINFCSVSAARTGEFETYFVEFKALVPDDLSETIDIQLTNKGEGYVLNYYLYKINGYFSNESVPPGDYSVSVSVANAKPDDFNFVYEKEFVVEESAVAIPFSIIIDNSSLNGDAGEVAPNDFSEVLSDEDNNDTVVSENDDEFDNETTSVDSAVEESINKESASDEEGADNNGFVASFLVSLFFSVFIIVLVVLVVLFIKKRS